MTARHYVEPTPEDQRIWRRVCCYQFHLKARYGDVCAEHQARAADLRDADLMGQAQEARFYWGRAGWRIAYSPLHIGDIAVGGGSYLMDLTS